MSIKIKFKDSKIKIRSFDYLSFNDFKEIFNKYYFDSQVISYTDNDLEMIKFNKTILLESYYFIDSNNKNNLILIKLILFPLLSRTLETRNMRIEELFYLVKYSTITSSYVRENNITSRNFLVQKVEYTDSIISKWIIDEKRLSYKLFQENISFYISTIIVGYSLPIKKYFRENHQEFLFDEMKIIAEKYYNSYFLKGFFKQIFENFSLEMKKESIKYDIDIEFYYLDYESFKKFILENSFLLDFKETREEYYKYCDGEYYKNEKNSK